MNLKLSTSDILKIISLVIVIGGMLWALSEKFNNSDVRLTAIETKLDMLLEERLIKMEKNELYRRMKESIVPSKK